MQVAQARQSKASVSGYKSSPGCEAVIKGRVRSWPGLTAFSSCDLAAFFAASACSRAFRTARSGPSMSRLLQPASPPPTTPGRRPERPPASQPWERSTSPQMVALQRRRSRLASSRSSTPRDGASPQKHHRPKLRNRLAPSPVFSQPTASQVTGESLGVTLAPCPQSV